MIIIRSIVSDRITSEEPSLTSKWRHWLRSSWDAQLYRRAHIQDPFDLLPQPEKKWMETTEPELQNSEYSVDWECLTLQQHTGMKETMDFLTKGCSCKKECTSMRYSCMDPDVDQGALVQIARTP